MKPLIVLLSLLLAACQPRPDGGSSRAPFLPREGAVLSLQAPLEIPSGSASVYIQGGHVTTLRQLKEIEPHCIFEVRQVARDKPMRITPDDFQIARIRWGTSTIGMGQPVRMAWLGFNDDAFPTQLFYKTELFLDSARQPAVYRLTCQADRALSGGVRDAYLSREEMQTAWGDLFRLNDAP